MSLFFSIESIQFYLNKFNFSYSIKIYSYNCHSKLSDHSNRAVSGDWRIYVFCFFFQFHNFQFHVSPLDKGSIYLIHFQERILTINNLFLECNNFLFLVTIISVFVLLNKSIIQCRLSWLCCELFLLLFISFSRLDFYSFALHTAFVKSDPFVSFCRFFAHWTQSFANHFSHLKFSISKWYPY